MRSGVCVVTAAGNGGYGIVTTYSGAGERAANMGTIAIPATPTSRSRSAQLIATCRTPTESRTFRPRDQPRMGE